LPDSTLVMEYLSRPETVPFLIFSDINMPKMSGYELRDLVLADPNLADKTVPYIFFSTANDPDTIKMAYKKSAQGFFTKITDYEEYKTVIKKIIEYWKAAKVPD
ncbi:MAG: response regulator, partial [Chryseobacterium sp.]